MDTLPLTALIKNILVYKKGSECLLGSEMKRVLLHQSPFVQFISFHLITLSPAEIIEDRAPFLLTLCLAGTPRQPLNSLCWSYDLTKENGV
jgi:hypothetical protein